MKNKKSEEKKMREKNAYHNTELLLRKYRDVVWSIEVSAIQAQISFEIEMGCKLDEFLDMSYAAGADLAGTDIQEQMRTMERNKKMLKIIESAVNMLKRKQADGEVYYNIIYYTYMTKKPYKKVENIIDKVVSVTGESMSWKTYYAKKWRAIETLSTILWGFTSKEANGFIPFCALSVAKGMVINMNKVYLITDFGAVADRNELQTEKIQKAIDECFKNGEGAVIVPEGVYLTGGIRIRSNCTLYLKSGATLKGSRNPEDYFGYLSDTVEPLSENEITDKAWRRTELDEVKDYTFMSRLGSRWNNALIKAVNAENVAIIGEENSFLDGSDCFDELGEENYRGPHCINMFNCKNVRLSGYSVKDSANWANALFYCENVVAENISVYAGHDGMMVQFSTAFTGVIAKTVLFPKLV